jgi:hypothetical protein
MTLREIWGRLVATKYTGTLEREVARLRLENRALLNSILGIAGVPPIVVAADESAAPTTMKCGAEKTPRESDTRATQGIEGVAKIAATEQSASALSVNPVTTRGATARGMKNVATPMRRRSWHQIYRMLEIDAARKKEAV